MTDVERQIEVAIATDVEHQIEVAAAAISGEFKALQMQVAKLKIALVEISLAISSERQHGPAAIPGVWRCLSRIQKVIEEAL